MNSAAQHLRALVARWPVIVLAGVIGLVAGSVTAPTSEARAAPLFGATHTLIVDAGQAVEPGRTPTDSANLEETTLLLTLGEVPKRAADALGISDPAELIANVLASSDPTVGTVRITAIDGDGGRAAEVANVLARELLSYLEGQAQQRRATEIDEANALARDLQGQLNSLPPLPAGAQADAVQNAPREALVRRFQAASDRVQQLQAQGTPSAGLRTLQEANAVRVDPRAIANERRALQAPRTRQNQQPATAVPSVDAATPAADAPLGRGPRMLIAGAVGLLLGTGLALVLERLQPRIRTKRAAEEAFGLPVIAEVPRLPRHGRRHPEVSTSSDTPSLQAESYRHLRAAILIASPRHLVESPADIVAPNGLDGAGETQPGNSVVPARAAFVANAPEGAGNWKADRFSSGSLRTVLVTSPGAGEGKTLTTLNLASALGEAGKSTLVIDFDLRRSRMHAYLGGKADDPGLGACLSRGDLAGVSKVERSLGSRVRVVPAGAPVANPSALLDAQRRLVPKARSVADIVLLDTPPLLTASDASELAPTADAVLVVCRTGKTTFDDANRASERLALLGVPVLGVVLVEASISRAARAYHRRSSRFGPPPGDRTAPAGSGAPAGAAREQAQEIR